MLRSFLFQKLRYESLPNPVVYVRRSKYLNICKRLIRLAFYAIFFILATISFGLIFVSSLQSATWQTFRLIMYQGDTIIDAFDNTELPFTYIEAGTKLHVLVPASRSNPNLCKTTLSLQLLGYPAPTFMGWDERFLDEHQVDGGARLGTKLVHAVHSVLKAPAHDDDLVLIADGYDTWFQLPPDVLVARYNAMNQAANERLALKAGKRAVKSLKIGQKIVFGARRSCDSTRVHGAPCEMTPEPPAPSQWYGGDNSISNTQYNVNPPRFLDSGYIMGRMIDVRALLVRAMEILESTPHSDVVYDGSAQPIFNRIYSDQEHQRNRWHHRVLPAALSRKAEFGLGIDYFSELSHSTFDAEKNAKYLTYTSDGGVGVADPSSGLLQPQLGDHYLSDCVLNLPTALPTDIATSTPPFINANKTLPSDSPSWNDPPLLTNLCTGTIPVLIHHNGDKAARESTWENIWFAPHAKEMLGKITGAAGGWTDTRKWVEWEELCPVEWEGELFGRSET